MLKKYNFLLSVTLLAIMAASCHSDVGEVNPNTEQTDQVTIPLGFDELEGNLTGFVFDESNNPISGAKVSIYSDQTTTNSFGVFTLEDTKFDPQGTFVKVEKDGYLTGSDMVYPNSNGLGTSKTMMLKILNEPSFEALDGGVVEINGGGTITFPPSSLIRANGSIYDGEVKATAYRLSPSNPELGNQMVGGLLGIDRKGRHRVLSTYGMLSVELRGFDNQKLRIKSDKVAELSFPIDNELQSALESDVPVWNFSFQDGLWHEYANTSNDQQFFNTNIDALGYWNFALANEVSQVCGRLIYDNGLPARSYVVQIINNGLPCRIGITDLDGYFCGKIPLGEELVFQVLHPMCGEILKEMTIGQFEAVGTIGDVTIDVEEKYISGTIECSGDLNSNSTIIIESNGITNVFYPNANGSFGINLDDILCGSISSYTLFAYDNETEMMSEVEELTANSSESLRLEICQSDCLASSEFVYEKQDYCTDGDYSRVNLTVTGGSGDYSYEWPNGSTDAFLSNPVSGEEVCVKVVDQSTGCVYIFCDDVFGYERLGISSLYSSNTECLITSGFIVLEVEGGKGDFEYNWSGPDGYMSNEAQPVNLLHGTYFVTINDEAGCEVTAFNQVYDATLQFEWDIEHFCDQSVITILDFDGYEPFTYSWDGGNPNGNLLFVDEPGFYEVTVTDANSCSRVRTVGLSQAGLLPTIIPTFECEKETVTFTELDTEFEYYYQPIGTSDRIPVEIVQDKVVVPILEAGYRFDIGSENEISSDCFTSEFIELPRFAGLDIGNVNATSCDSCEDGSIEYDINIGEDCIDCTPGEVVVLRAEDKTDVTELNTEQLLGKGEYYVVVLDNNSGCYIAHSLEEVE